ncbi:MAG: hypothetical protein ACTSYZ_06775 [Candidatus Helarchaeota archaeon]
MTDPFKLETCPAKFFVGRKREIDQFSGILQKIADRENISHGLILHGREGIGRRSFLKQIESIASSNGFLVIRYDVPLINIEGYFDVISNELDEITKPVDKKKPITKPGKKAPLLKSSYEIPDMSKYIDSFLKKIVKKLPKIIKNIQGNKFNKKGILIVSNLVERFIILNHDNAFDVLKAIVDAIKTDVKNPNLPVLFLMSVWEKYYPKVRYVLEDFHEIGLPTLNNADAIELLDKRADAAGIKFSEEIKENLLRHSGGIPLYLVYNGGWLYENRGDTRELGKDVWFKAEGGVKEGFGRELKELTEDERKILQSFAMENANFADIDIIARSIGAKSEDIKPILEKMIGKYLSKEDSVYYITLDSFWIYLRSSLGDIAVDAQARGLIKVAMNLAENGRLLEDFQFEELERLRSDSLTAGLVSAVEHIANGYYDIAMNYYNYGYYNEVFKFILLAGDSLVKVNEKEKAANILESFTEKFLEKGLLDYGRDVLINAIDVNRSLGEPEKVKELINKLANLFVEKAEDCIKDKAYPLARANYTQAKKYFEEINATNEVINVLTKAAKTFFSNNEYFYAWQFYTNLSNVYAIQGQVDKAKDILEDSIQKFQNLGLADFVEKLNRTKVAIEGGSS